MALLPKTVLVSLSFTAVSQGVMLCQTGYAGSVLKGISNHGANKTDPYATAGDRSYLIGTQDGNFPDLGSHVPGEMGGLWIHPIKLIDGFWARVSEEGTDQEVQLQSATE